MKKDSIRIFAPATVANVGPGFDVLGFAIDAPGDEVVVRHVAKPGVRILEITGDGGRLPLDPEKNTVSVPILEFLRNNPTDGGFEISLHKHMPLGSGLGSSAASSVAGVFAVNEMLGRPVDKATVLVYALEGERVACGAAHADNAAACLYGGFTLVRSNDPPDIIPLKPGCELFAAVVHPHIEIRTEDSRRIMRTYVTLAKAVVQWGNIAGMVAGILMGDSSLISRSMTDVIVEPIRGVLIPGFDAAKHAAMEAGALGCSISGSGPSMFALCDSHETAERAGLAMSALFTKIGLGSDTYVSGINLSGPKILD
jgi:homoserine kinase